MVLRLYAMEAKEPVLSEQSYLGINRVAVTSETEFLTPEARRLYDWWQSFAPQFPRRRDFDIVEHRPLSANIFLVQVVDENTYDFRLRGEDIVQLIGRRAPQQRATVDSADAHDHMVARYYREIVRNPRPMRCFGTLSTFGLPVQFESIDCPMRDDGNRLAYIIGVLVPLPGQEKIWRDPGWR